MAQFHGWIKGQRGQASRLGSKNSGLQANLASWQGSVGVSIWHNEETGKDIVNVVLQPHVNGAGVVKLLYNGPIGGE